MFIISEWCVFYWYTLNSLVLRSYACVHNIMDARYIQYIHSTCNIHHNDIQYTHSFFLGQSSIALNPGVGCMRMVQQLALEFVPVLWACYMCWQRSGADVCKRSLETVIGKNGGKGPIGMGTLNNQPHVHLIYSGYLLGIPSWELTYPLKSPFWRWFSFSPGGIC